VSDSAQLEIAPDAEPTANLATRATKLLPQTEPTFTTRRGAVWTGDALDLLKAMPKASVNLVVTSPPYALEFQKEYGNEPQDAYVEWFLPFAKEIRRVLKKDGSFVVNVAGAWQKGQPVRSLYHFKLLIALVETGKFFLAQEVYWYNPSDWTGRRGRDRPSGRGARAADGVCWPGAILRPWPSRITRP